MKDVFRGPKQGTAGDRIAALLCKAGPMEYRGIVQTLTKQGMSPNTVRNTLRHMHENNWLKMNGKKHEPVLKVLQQYSAAPADSEVTKAPKLPTYRPLQAKNIPSLDPLLVGRFRTDICFKNGSIGFQAGYSTSGGLTVFG